MKGMIWRKIRLSWVINLIKEKGLTFFVFTSKFDVLINSSEYNIGIGIRYGQLNKFYNFGLIFTFKIEGKKEGVGRGQKWLDDRIRYWDEIWSIEQILQFWVDFYFQN